MLVLSAHVGTANALGRLLTTEGYEVVVATVEAQARQRAQQRHFHLIILDLGPPREGYLDLLRELAGGGQRVLALVGFVRDQDPDDLRAAGAAGHLLKPVGLPQLQAAMTQATAAR